MLDLKGDGAAVRAIVWTIWALLATVVLHYIRRGYQVRSIFKSMAKEGIVSAAPQNVARKIVDADLVSTISPS